MAPEQVVADDGFVPASSTSSPWYENLKLYGSCLQLYDLLAKRRELVHELGPEGITALHKGVQHGCVKLVRFILVDMFDGFGKCTCRRCGAENACVLTREGLLRKTCEYGSTAVNMAVVSGSPKMVLLLKWAIDESERCRTRDSMYEELSRKDEGTGFNAKSFGSVRARFLGEKAGSGEKEPTEITNDGGIPLEVPDVKDDAIGENIYGADRSKKILEVYELIEEKLNKNWGDDDELVTMLKAMCKENEDFGFVPVAHTFLHFLFSMYTDCWDSDRPFERVREKILKDILEACNERDDEEGNSESMLVTLFNILDPQGRTILHVARQDGKSHSTGAVLSTKVVVDILRGIEEALKCKMMSTRMRECVNARDGAGRTILHLACINEVYLDFYDSQEWMRGKLDWDVPLSPLCCKEFEALKRWCSPWTYCDEDTGCRPIHLAIVFNCTRVLDHKWALDGIDNSINAAYGEWAGVHLPFQIAALLGRVTFVEHLLKVHTKSKNIKDKGLCTSYDMELDSSIPAIHCAAIFGHVEVIQTILKYPVYDPMCLHHIEGTALHILLNMKSLRMILERFKALALLHVLPNSQDYIQLKDDFQKFDVDKTKARMFSEDEVSCINLLHQAGIDLWTPRDGFSTDKNLPSVAPQANNEARKWWYEKVVTEVVTQKTSITSAANATSVIGALIATTSIIGPLQPPLSYTGEGGYIDTTRITVRVYLVCNNLSFFFSIASILMAVLPAIPMPKESMYDELLRSQRCLKAAAMMLLIAIICILISFSSASIAVVSPDWSDKQLVVACVVVGGGVCIVVLAIYIIRLLRMLFHTNARFRRRFAKYMYF